MLRKSKLNKDIEYRINVMIFDYYIEKLFFEPDFVALLKNIREKSRNKYFNKENIHIMDYVSVLFNKFSNNDMDIETYKEFLKKYSSQSKDDISFLRQNKNDFFQEYSLDFNNIVSKVLYMDINKIKVTPEKRFGLLDYIYPNVSYDFNKDKKSFIDLFQDPVKGSNYSEKYNSLTQELLTLKNIDIIVSNDFRPKTKCFQLYYEHNNSHWLANFELKERKSENKNMKIITYETKKHIHVLKLKKKEKKIKENAGIDCQNIVIKNNTFSGFFINNNLDNKDNIF